MPVSRFKEIVKRGTMGLSRPSRWHDPFENFYPRHARTRQLTRFVATDLASGKGYWASLSSEERSAEMKRRAAKRKSEIR
jgi:hypothetical protein